MSARALVSLVDRMLVEEHGRDAVDAWHAQGVVDEVADRRRENALAALSIGGEVIG